MLGEQTCLSAPGNHPGKPQDHETTSGIGASEATKSKTKTSRTISEEAKHRETSEPPRRELCNQNLSTRPERRHEVQPFAGPLDGRVARQVRGPCSPARAADDHVDLSPLVLTSQASSRRQCNDRRRDGRRPRPEGGCNQGGTGGGSRNAEEQGKRVPVL